MAMQLTSYAAKDQTDTYEYEVRNGKAVLTRYATDSNATRVSVPDKVDGYKVSGLEGTFKENQRIEQVILPESIEYLGDNTFSRCRKLNKINLPDSIYDIGANCFEYTSIKTIKIPSRLSEISVSTFHKCENLTNVNLENSNIKSIGIYAFGNCISLKSINLPDTLEYIGEAAFGYCDSIEEFTIPKNVKNIELISWPIIYGKSLKRIVNLTNIEWDKGVFEDPTDTYYNSWFTAEYGYETVNSLMPNTTIYRHKKDSSEKYVNKYSDIINQIIFSSKEYNSGSEILKKAKSLMPEIQIKTLSCEITLESFYPATDGNMDFPDGYAGSGCFKISASNSALENDECTNYVWFSVEPQKYIENNPSQPGKPEQPDEPEKPQKPDPPSGDLEKPGSQDPPSKPNNPEIPDLPATPGNIDKPSDDNTTTDNENKPSSDGNSGNVGGENNNSGNAKPSGGSGSGSGGGSSSGGGGGRRSSGGRSSNNAPQGLLISKPSVIMGVWEQVDGRWKLKISDGSYANSQWASLDGKWYLLGADGYMLNSWQMVNSKWYLLGPDGAMLTGWQAVDGKWYWLEENGEMITGWEQIGNKWYYLGQDGAMLAGTTTPDGYAVNENGEWIQ